MSELSNGQLQYLMRKFFDCGIDPFLRGVCKNREQLESGILSLKSVAKQKGYVAPVFWFKQSDPYYEFPSTFSPGDKAYFIGENEITLAKIHYVGITKTGPTLEKISENEVLDYLMENKLYNRDIRDHAFMNAGCLVYHPELIFTLPEYLEVLAAYSAKKDIWEIKFPGMIETNFDGKDVFDPSKFQTAGNIFDLFVQTIGGSPLSPEIKREINRKLPE